MDQYLENRDLRQLENVSIHFMKKFTILISILIHAVLAIGQIANDNQNFFDYTYDKTIIKTNKIKLKNVEDSLEILKIKLSVSKYP